jgi:ferredoxin
MKIKVDQTKCQGCGACVSIAPKTFELIKRGDWFVSQPKNPPQDDLKDLKGAVSCCPAKAITLEEKNEV